MRSFTLSLILGASLTGFSQTTVSHGTGAPAVGTNNGKIVVVNKYQMTEDVARQLLAENAGKEPNQGVLYPSHAKTDYGECAPEILALAPPWFEAHIPTANDYVVKLGSTTAICTKLPCDLIQVEGKVVLSIQKLGTSVGVQAQFGAPDGNMYAVLDGNEWHFNDQEREAWYPRRVDTHALQLKDRQDKEMLWVSLENPHFVSIRGTFRFSDGAPAVRVTDDKTFIGRSSSEAGCQENFKIAIVAQ